MRILADEDFPGRAVRLLRERGHDVLWAHTDRPGAPDAELLTLAQAEDRILVTLDKDFGELAFGRGLPASSGIVLARLSHLPAAEVVRIILTAFEASSPWRGHFSVIEAGRVRRRPLPPARASGGE